MRKPNAVRLRSMRFADPLWRCRLVGVLCVAISGCAGVAGPKPAPGPQTAAATAPQPAAAAPQASGASPASGQSAAAAAARANETPSGISPDVQRTFEY